MFSLWFSPQSKDDYLRLELESLPDACSADSEAYKRVRIEDFGRAVLRGMGWDGRDTVDPAVYEIRPRPERLGLGAMPVLLRRDVKSAAKKSELQRRQQYSGIRREWDAEREFGKGMQVGIIAGPFAGGADE